MGLFSKYRPLYREPERLSPEETRARRLQAMLEREQRFQMVPNFPSKLAEVQRRAALSQVTKNILSEDAERLVKAREVFGPKARSIRAATLLYQVRNQKQHARLSGADHQYWQRLVSLERQQRQRARPSGADKRQYNPTGKDFASTIYGTVARVSGARHALNAESWLPTFINPSKVLPCLERVVRREVMFAKKHGGKGYRVRHRRKWSSGVPC